VSGLLGPAARLYGLAWELRRRAYALGLRRPVRVPARVVSIGNLTVGGTGKTTLVLHLAARALETGANAAVVCRRYRPGPGGRGDEEDMYRRALGPERVYAGTSKRRLAAAAAADGRTLILVDDGFSHWGLARDVDLLLVDAGDPLGGEALLPAGRLREPLRAMQRAQAVILTRSAAPADPVLRERLRRLAPAALFARASHRPLAPRPGVEPGRAWLVTATGNPSAVAATAREAGYDLAGVSVYRDHHWFADREARRESERARAAGASLLLTAKDAVRWPAAGGPFVVLEVAWTWHEGGVAIERMVTGESGG